jgi:hypothetical protein
MNLSPLFEQYVKHYRIPQLEFVTKKRRKKTMTHLRWKTDTADFSMPLTCAIDGQETQLLISSEWQKIQSKEAITFDQVHYYFELKKLMRAQR